MGLFVFNLNTILVLNVFSVDIFGNALLNHITINRNRKILLSIIFLLLILLLLMHIFSKTANILQLTSVNKLQTSMCVPDESKSCLVVFIFKRDLPEFMANAKMMSSVAVVYCTTGC